MFNEVFKMEWKEISKKWIKLSNRMWTKSGRELVDELFVEYTDTRIKLENLTKHNNDFIQDFKKVKLGSLVPNNWRCLSKEEVNMDVWVKS